MRIGGGKGGCKVVRESSGQVVIYSCGRVVGSVRMVYMIRKIRIKLTGDFHRLEVIIWMRIWRRLPAENIFEEKEFKS